MVTDLQKPMMVIARNKPIEVTNRPKFRADINHQVRLNLLHQRLEVAFSHRSPVIRNNLFCPEHRRSL